MRHLIGVKLFLVASYLWQNLLEDVIDTINFALQFCTPKEKVIVVRIKWASELFNSTWGERIKRKREAV